MINQRVDKTFFVGQSQHSVLCVGPVTYQKPTPRDYTTDLVKMVWKHASIVVVT